MTTPDMPEDLARRDRSRRHRLRIRNERLKMIATAVDRLATVVLAGAVLAPIFNRQPVSWHRLSVWIFAALLLHLMALYMIGRQQEEE